MRTAFWNRQKSNKYASVQAEWLLRPGLPDVLILAEVTPKALAVFERDLRLTWQFAASDKAQHGIAIGVSEAFDVVGVDRPHGECASARRCRDAQALALNGAFDGVAMVIAGWHAPYAARDRRHTKAENAAYKQQAYQHVAGWLNGAPRPLVLGLDGNNWSDSVSGEPPAPKGDPWDDERLFHSVAAPHQLKDVVRVVATRAGPAPASLPFTRRNRSGDYRMDRIYVSDDFRVVRAGVRYGDGTHAPVVATSPPATRIMAPGSDHALVFADLELR